MRGNSGGYAPQMPGAFNRTITETGDAMKAVAPLLNQALQAPGNGSKRRCCLVMRRKRMLDAIEFAKRRGSRVGRWRCARHQGAQCETQQHQDMSHDAMAPRPLTLARRADCGDCANTVTGRTAAQKRWQHRRGHRRTRRRTFAATTTDREPAAARSSGHCLSYLGKDAICGHTRSMQAGSVAASMIILRVPP